MRLLAMAAVLAACDSPKPSTSESAPTPGHVVVMDASVTADASTDTMAAGRLEPLIQHPTIDPSCPVRFDELDASEPPIIELSKLGRSLMDECPETFSATTCDPTINNEDDDAQCFTGTMRGGRQATVVTEGPAGSGRFWTIGFSVEKPAPRYTCMMGSTVGWRLLVDVGKQLAPLPWLDDADGDGENELIVWTRLPWGSSEVENAVYPIVYVLDGDRLVRRDDKAAALRAKVGAAYKALDALDKSGMPHRCIRALASLR